MKPTLREVAARAKVSEATVSRVVNGKGGVAAETRAVVLAILEELGYEQVGIGRLARAPVIGLIVPELDNPIFPAFAQAIEANLARQGIATIMGTTTLEGTAEAEYIDLLMSRGVAGVVVVSGMHADTTADTSIYGRITASGRPLVLVNGFAPAVRAAFFSSDDAAAAETGVGHLADLGHRRIGLIVGPSRYRPSERKQAGYRRGLHQRSGAQAEQLVVEAPYTVEGGHVAGARLLDEGATGVLAGSDLMALGAVRAARERGLGVPADVSVVGYDDIPLAPYTDPPLTTLRQPVRAIGAAVATMLSQRLGGAEVPDHGEYLFRPDLIVRGSTGPCPDQADAPARPSRVR
jgi:LacI family transcriptional regulator, repressor for deo operon, udp, cdd, tsx, nupC, and nupG